MATFTAVGPAVALDGPLPVAPPHSLLNTSGVVKERDATRVLNGVNLWGYPESCPGLWEPCSDGTFRVKDDGDGGSTVRFDSFVVYQSVTCSTISVGTDGEFFDRAQRVLDATASSGVERALASGVTGSSNPFIADSNVDILNSGTAVSPRVGVSFLEQAIGDTCRMGMIHATPAIVAGLNAPIGPDSVGLSTGNDTPLVSGMGYQGIDTAALGTPTAKQDWAFATGPVEVYLGPVRLDQVKDNLDRAHNILTFRAEMYVLAVWDTALQAAVLIDWSTTP